MNLPPFHGNCRCTIVVAEIQTEPGLGSGAGDTDGNSVIISDEPYDINDDKVIEKAFKKFLKDTADIDIEKAMIFSPNGIKYEIDGTEMNVNIGLIGEDALKGAKVIHNHIKKYADSFSKEDFIAYFDYNLDSLEVAFRGKRHRIWWEGNKPNNFNPSRIYDSAFYEVSSEAFAEAIKGKVKKSISNYDVIKKLENTLKEKGLRLDEL